MVHKSWLCSYSPVFLFQYWSTCTWELWSTCGQVRQMWLTGWVKSSCVETIPAMWPVLCTAVWKLSHLCGEPTICSILSKLPPRSMCALPQFVLIPCFPSGGETIQTMACLNILLLFCLNIWPTTNMFVILPSDFHTHMTSHYCLPRQFESQYKSLFVQWIEHCVWIFQSGLWKGPQPACEVWDFWS